MMRAMRDGGNDDGTNVTCIFDARDELMPHSASQLGHGRGHHQLMTAMSDTSSTLAASSLALQPSSNKNEGKETRSAESESERETFG